MAAGLPRGASFKEQTCKMCKASHGGRHGQAKETVTGVLLHGKKLCLCGWLLLAPFVALSHLAPLVVVVIEKEVTAVAAVTAK